MGALAIMKMPTAYHDSLFTHHSAPCTACCTASRSLVFWYLRKFSGFFEKFYFCGNALATLARVLPQPNTAKMLTPALHVPDLTLFNANYRQFHRTTTSQHSRRKYLISRKFTFNELSPCFCPRNCVLQARV